MPALPPLGEDIDRCISGGGGGGGIFIYSCSALLISFEIDCFYGL
jgi:hypothetical protein